MRKSLEAEVDATATKVDLWCGRHRCFGSKSALWLLHIVKYCHIVTLGLNSSFSVLVFHANCCAIIIIIIIIILIINTLSVNHRIMEHEQTCGFQLCAGGCKKWVQRCAIRLQLGELEYEEVEYK